MIYAMSDIHGCIDELKEMMKKVDIAENNRIVFLGDYMDYGDNSYQVLKYLKDLQGRYGVEKVIVLKGNHGRCFWNGLMTTVIYIPMDRKKIWFSMIGFARIWSVEEIL